MDRQAVLTYKPPRIALICLAIATSLHVLSPAGTVLHFPYRLLGAVALIAGFGIMMAAWVLFQRQRTAICPTCAATTLVMTGPYRWTRNPMYLGMVLLLCGAGFFLGTVIAFLAPLAFYIIVNEFFIPYEERSLELIFGDGYRAYQARVRRWL
jgi:protein-S-isoprenylcysteine O-methyltransferase Ste14